ncbi:MAG: hypothetical protein EWV80_09930, partial [Microcystis aeruginosa Ma_QC_B_20070730_S2]
FFGKIGCNGRLFVFLDKNNYFFKKTLFYFFFGYFILWKSPMILFAVCRIKILGSVNNFLRLGLNIT